MSVVDVAAQRQQQDELPQEQELQEPPLERALSLSES